MSRALPSRVRCGDIEVDLKAGEVCTLEQRVRLQEQPLQVLRILIQRAGKIVTRDEIKAKLWPNDTVVEFDNAINTAIRKLRIAFCDSSDHPKYIETVARRGYRFMAAVEPLDSVAEGGPETGVRDDTSDIAPLQASLSAGLTGKTVSHYRVLEVIGGGGMGVVYRAEDLRLDRSVAIKFLPEEMGVERRAVERFEREARAASALDHPNICSIYEFGEHEGRPFIVLQLLAGQTLRDCLAAASERGALQMPQVVELAAQIASGLEAAHERGIIHRDIKPANIFITTKGLAKILDFGLAKMLESAEESPPERKPDVGLPTTAVAPSMDLSLSREGVAIGTAGYMSPEQVRGERVDARTDLFSFGLVLYEMASGGRRAFSAETAELVREAILHQSPVPVRELNPAVPPTLEHIIHKALIKERQLRYQSASEILADLKALTNSDTTGRKESPGRFRRRWRAAVVTSAIVVLALAAYGVYWRSHRVPLLAEKDTIVLADFTNKTGETLFDGALRQAVALQLDQSPYVNILPEPRMMSVLSQMERSPEQPVTVDVAAEICLRTHSQAVLAGSIASVESSYHISLESLSCQTEHPMAVVNVRAKNRSEVLQAVDDAGNEMRRKLGEPLASVNRFDQPLGEATTSSLEALKAFSLSKKFGSPTERIPYLKRALELDPDFALAYTNLGVCYMNVGEVSLGAANIKKAYDLRDRTSQKERFYIEATYYSLVTRELDRGEQSAREWEQNYPGDWHSHNDLAIIYAQLGRTEEAANEMRQVIRLAPDNPGAYGNLIGMLSTLDRLSEAQEVYQAARSRNLDGPYLRQYKYVLAFLQGDTAGMQEQVQWAMGEPRTQGVLLAAQSDTEAYHGRLQSAREFSRRAVESAKRADATETAATFLSGEALREAEIGNADQAQRLAAQALSLNRGRDVRIYASLALARAGDVAQAQEIAESLDREFPLDTMLQNYSLPVVRAAIQLEQHKPLEAIETLEVSQPYELGQPSLSYLYPAYLRGEAYLKTGQGEKAAAQFQKMIDHPGVVQNFVTGALARLQLARAQAIMGDRNVARKSYEQFLKLWKNADHDIAIYRQAKAEDAKLR